MIYNHYIYSSTNGYNGGNRHHDITLVLLCRVTSIISVLRNYLTCNVKVISLSGNLAFRVIIVAVGKFLFGYL